MEINSIKNYRTVPLFLPKKNNTIGIFAQDDWKLNSQLTLQSGIRVDAHNRYGDFILPRLSIMYRANQQVTMRMGGGLGYKTPTLFNAEIDERNYRYLVGYSDGIKAEKSVGANFDVNYKTHVNGWNITLNQTFFYNQINRSILLGAISYTLPPQWLYTNQTEPIQTGGFETYVQCTKEELEVYLGYVYTNAKRKYEFNFPNLPLIARNKLASIVAYEFSKKFRAGIEAAYTGKQFLENGQTTTPYVFAALMMRYNVGKVSLVLNCENLLDYRQNKTNQVVYPPFKNPTFPEIWAPLDGRVVNLSVFYKIR